MLVKFINRHGRRIAFNPTLVESIYEHTNFSDITCIGIGKDEYNVRGEFKQVLEKFEEALKEYYR